MLTEKSNNTDDNTVKIACICKHCGYNDHSEATIQFDFANSKVIYVCPSCRKINEMTIVPVTGGYPRIGRM